MLKHLRNSHTVRRVCAAGALAVLLAACVAAPGARAESSPSQVGGAGRRAAPQRGVAASRAARLRRGINTSHWFAQVSLRGGYTREHLLSHMTDEDVETIAALGFDHVRLSVDPAPMFDATAPERLPAEYVGILDAAIGMILAGGLAVVVDIHPAQDFKKRLSADDGLVEGFAAFWGALAGHLSRHPPESLFLELLNEPQFDDRYRWMGVQARLARAVREGAPRHTIVATGNEWSSVDRLAELEPLGDPNVVYAFHFYEPHLFTHQGATWGSPEWPHVRGISYPSSPSSVAAELAAVEDPAARRALAAYGEERWGAAAVRREISKAARWARRHGVPVVCNEFGVFTQFTPPASRAAWLRDVRAALEAEGIGWAMWDYAGGFRVVSREGGRLEPDAAVVAALGLKPRQRRR